jgi:signal transduction histidine kinase
VLTVISLSRVYTSIARYEETQIYPDIILQNNISSSHFVTPLYHAGVVSFYGSEEAIIAGEFLDWRVSHTVHHAIPGEHTPFPNFDFNFSYNSDDVYTEYNRETYEYSYYIQDQFIIVEQYELLRSDGLEQYAVFHISQTDSSIDLEAVKAQYEEYAINHQLYHEFQRALNVLNNTEGLLYFIETINSNGDVFIYSNVTTDRQTLDYFESRPAFLTLTKNQSLSINSSDNEYDHYRFLYHIDWESISGNIGLAFTSRTISAFNNTAQAVRTGYIIDFSIMAVCIVLSLMLLIVLFLGAGRRYITENGEANVNTSSEGSSERVVHFLPIDKPYLDISLALLIGWVVFVLYFIISTNLLDTIWRNMNFTAMDILIAIVTVLLLTPALLLLLNFIKRIKAGKFWKHTLIFAVLSFIVRILKALWAGVPLTGRVIIITITAFLMLFTIAVTSTSYYSGYTMLLIIVFCIVVFVRLSLYAKRIRALFIGSKRASGGDYSTPIQIRGGELGSIAHSINNISAGINIAVEDRLKSERLKTELITNVSHDIRTPLTSLITYTDLLKTEGLDSEKAPEYLEVLIQKSQRLKILTDELFEAAKAVTGNIDVNLSELDIVSLINQVLGELDSSVKSSGLDLRINLLDKLMVKADGRLMWRVLENLMFNVFKFSLPNSRVYIDVAKHDEHYARIDIKNISAAALNFDPSELTERFKRGDDSRSDGGAGLGLSIVQSFVAAQHGWFTISIDGDLFKATVMLPLS